MKYIPSFAEFINENINESIGKIFYHGTLSSNLNSIKEKGLLCNTKTNKAIHGFNTEGQISITPDYDTAYYYASLFSGKNPVTILKLSLDHSFKIIKGFSSVEFVLRQDVNPKFIVGANEGDTFVTLKDLDPMKSYVDYKLLKGSNIRRAEQDHKN